MEDLFGDLVPPARKTGTFSDAGSTSTVERGPRSTARPEVPDVFSPAPAPEVVKPESPVSHAKPSGEALFTFSKDQLKDLLTETVQQAVDSTFSKIVKSLRTVCDFVVCACK